MSKNVKHGFLLIHKPAGISSFGCIAHLKKFTGKTVKIGHAGTLDPFASGLLIIGLGREFTRELASVAATDKTYVAMGKLGELTDTLDCTGSVADEQISSVTEENLRRVIGLFGSSYEQIPPLYSALKYKGKPLYKLARQEALDQQTVDFIVAIKKRMVEIHELDLLSFNFPFFTIRARVSHGTYIRSLVNDIAVAAGSCATTYELERSSIGQFCISQAIEPRDIQGVDDINRFLVTLHR